MTSLRESLRQVASVDAVRVAAVIDVATGMIVESVGAHDPGLADAAADMAEEVRVARAVPGPRGPAGALEQLTAVTPSRIHLLAALPEPPAEGLLLFVDLDRSRANVALATLLVARLALGVLA